jgi:hypothetical protein
MFWCFLRTCIRTRPVLMGRSYYRVVCNYYENLLSSVCFDLYKVPVLLSSFILVLFRILLHKYQYMCHSCVAAIYWFYIIYCTILGYLGRRSDKYFVYYNLHVRNYIHLQLSTTLFHIYTAYNLMRQYSILYVIQSSQHTCNLHIFTLIESSLSELTS